MVPTCIQPVGKTTVYFYEKPMRLNLLVLLLCSISLKPGAFSQAFHPLREGEDLLVDGFSMRYDITNARSTAYRGANYERYEIQVSLTKTDAPFFRIFDKSGDGQILEQDKLAEFTCLNAVGIRLTSLNTTIPLPILYTKVIQVDQEPIEQLPVGYGMQVGESLTSRIIVIVPEGEAPDLKAALFIPL